MTKQKKRPRSRDCEAGFTYMEILMGVIIVGILSAVVGITVSSGLDTARKATARNQIENFKTALNMYYIDCGIFPSEEEGLRALWEKPSSEPAASHWQRPYIDKQISADPWGNQYVYRTPGPNGLDFEIISYGSDGSEGGSGPAADIKSSE